MAKVDETVDGGSASSLASHHGKTVLPSPLDQAPSTAAEEDEPLN